MITNLGRTIRHTTNEFITAMGYAFVLHRESITLLFRRKITSPVLVSQIYFTGVEALPILAIISLGIGAAVMELVVGIPLAYATAIQLARFSMFSLAPILSLLLLVIFLWPKLWPRLTGSIE